VLLAPSPGQVVTARISSSSTRFMALVVLSLCCWNIAVFIIVANILGPGRGKTMSGNSTSVDRRVEGIVRYVD
jgi:hypothetical protein